MSSETGTPMTPEEMVAQLRGLRAQIPDYAQLTPSAAKSKRRAATVTDLFVQAMINAVGASMAMQGALDQTAESLQQQADRAMRWSAVTDELRAMLQGVTAADLIRRHRLGLTALQAYAISKQLVREPGHAALLPHLQEMRRHNHFGHRRRRTAGSGTPAEVPQPTPQPTSPPTSPQPSTALPVPA